MRVTLSASALQLAVKCLTAAIASVPERGADSHMKLVCAKLELRRALAKVRRKPQTKKVRRQWKLTA